MKKTGKVKAIPVTEIVEGMQIVYRGRVCEVLKNKGERSCLRPIEWEKGVIDPIPNTELKTLVVEYHNDAPLLPYMDIPLKYSQWQAAIDNGEVDSDKTVEFEQKLSKVYVDEQDAYGYDLWLAKIIPAKKKRIPDYKIINELKKVNGALSYDGDASVQVLLPTKEGYLRVGVTDEDVAPKQGIWFDYYKGLNNEIPTVKKMYTEEEFNKALNLINNLIRGDDGWDAAADEGDEFLLKYGRGRKPWTKE